MAIYSKKRISPSLKKQESHELRRNKTLEEYIEDFDVNEERDKLLESRLNPRAIYLIGNLSSKNVLSWTFADYNLPAA